MQNIEQSRDLAHALGGLTLMSANDWLCLSCLCDVNMDFNLRMVCVFVVCMQQS